MLETLETLFPKDAVDTRWHVYLAIKHICVTDLYEICRAHRMKQAESYANLHEGRIDLAGFCEMMWLMRSEEVAARNINIG